ncbi:ABC transporter permease subunit [Anaerotruncus colihominis]|jgi:ABC-2 type transport system permease protein|uniref:ABC transporter n=1 Tax=Anaerotruncus colihominis TaxID=169435 RepID=A0A845RIQ3_9FIRM|nr:MULTISPECIES: ABC transporter permease subunit [Anaerotruncus]MCI8491489.1 ABC transporter permease subunit [Anaerotruncus sp.]NBI79387.1 ABC transporter [Anaerotruncus colihominis]
MIAIFKRELNACFDMPPGYVFIAVYDLFAGYFFFSFNLYGNSTDMRALFEMMFTVTLFLIPILTMRLMSEDRRAHTDQLLLMAPVSTTGIVMGKLLAALLVYLVAMAITLVQAFMLSCFAPVEWSVILGHFIGLFLLGAALIAVGLLISTLTENQIIAAIGGFCVGFFLILLDSLAGLIKNTVLAGFVTDLSFQTHYRNFTLGIFNLADVVFYLSMTALFVFLTVCAFEKRRIA